MLWILALCCLTHCNLSQSTSYLCAFFRPKKKNNFKTNASTRWKRKKSSQLASLMDGWFFENFMCSIGKIFFFTKVEVKQLIFSTPWIVQSCGHLSETWKIRKAGAATRLLMRMNHFFCYVGYEINKGIPFS